MFFIVFNYFGYNFIPKSDNAKMKNGIQQSYRKNYRNSTKEIFYLLPRTIILPKNLHITAKLQKYYPVMSALQSVHEQNCSTTEQHDSNNHNLFKNFQTEVQAQKQEKQRIDSISNLITVLNHNQSSKGEVPETILQKKSDSDSESSSKSSQSKSGDTKQQFRDSESKNSVEVSFSESVKENLKTASASKPKSKFAKLHSNNFNVQEPHIITSSYKSFCSPSKSSLNMNSKHNQASNYLTPGNNLPSSKKQVTSAGNLVQEEENQPATGAKTNRSAFGNKSQSSQVAKQTTFAALPSKTYHEQQHSNGISLYEQVLAKNFEVIDNLLRKLNKIYSNQEEYENSLIEITQKLHKIQADNQNIHHEFRTSHFMIDKKLNSITNEYSNMLHDMNLLKKMFKENGGRGSFFVGLKGNMDDDNESSLNSRRISTQRRNSKRCSGARSSQRNSNLSVQRKQSFTNSPRSSQRKSTRNSNSTNQRVSNWTQLKGIDEQNLGKILLEQINESGSWQGSQSEMSYDNINSRKFHRNSQGSQQQIEYDQRNSRVRNHSGQSKKQKNGQRISIDNFGREDIDVIKSYISNEVIKMSSNSQINKYTLLGIESTITKKFQTFEQKIDEKFFEFKRDIIEERIERQMRKSIVDQLEQKTTAMIQKDITALKQQTIDRISTFQKRFNKQMQKKCDKQQVRQDLKQILESMNRKVNTLMDECYHKFAQRNQSKRAILFLEKKINKLIETAHRFKNFEVQADTIENTKCLSCSKNVPVSSGHHYTQSQPMFTQVHCGIQQQDKSENVYGNDYLETTRKVEMINQAQKRKVKFTDISNLNYASVSQIFDKSIQPPQSPKGNRLAASSQKPMADTSSSNKDIFSKKLMKNSQTVDSVHFGTMNSHMKTKVWLVANENRPTTSMNASIHEAKNWKSKATSILKKEGADWRSKSHYKKAA